METYMSKRPDGSNFAVEWEPLNASMASIKGQDGLFCRYCLEDGSGGFGVLVDGICSKGCEGSMQWLKDNAHRLVKKVVEVQEATDKVEEKMDYVADPRALKYFDGNSRVTVMFSELARAGSKGLLISEVCQTLQTLFKADAKSVKQDVSTKCSKWGNKATNKHHDEWWLLQGGRPSKGRPRNGETKDRRLFVVFCGEEIPAEAFIPDDKKGMPDWLISQLEKV